MARGSTADGTDEGFRLGEARVIPSAGCWLEPAQPWDKEPVWKDLYTPVATSFYMILC